MITISPHTADRYRSVHPTATDADIRTALEAGEPMSGDVVWAITQRRGEPMRGDRFVWTGDGIFTISPSGSGESVRTWLRLSEGQQAALRRGLMVVPPRKEELAEFVTSLQASRRAGQVLRGETVDKLLGMVGAYLAPPEKSR